MVNAQNEFDKLIQVTLNDRLEAIEMKLNADVLFYYGTIHPKYYQKFEFALTDLVSTKEKHSTLAILLHTNGGDSSTVERFVNMIRSYYDVVDFYVPTQAMSAGTIWCMSGNRIVMAKHAALGPIDPQVLKNGKFIPALGYLDAMQALIDKQNLSQAELSMLLQLDLGEMKQYEQYRDYSISLLKKWLVRYKFANWNNHRTTDPGSPVTEKQKIKRAEEIAILLNSIAKWHIHGRHIPREVLREELKIEIDNLEEDEDLATKIIQYSDLLINYIERHGVENYIHTRNYI